MKIDKILPADIERESFRIIGEELQGRDIDPEKAPVIKRVIHTTADFDYADNLYFSPDVVNIALQAIRGGAVIVTDTQMALSGINKKTAEKFGVKVVCFMSDESVAAEAKRKGVTRAQVSMEKARELGENVIFAVGNAPTALIKLREMADDGYRPKLIIGVPVGFVNVCASKELIIESNVPCIVARGRKGGSNVAACIVNALLYMLDETRGASRDILPVMHTAATENSLAEWRAAAQKPDMGAMERAKAHWDSIAKPLYGLGVLEDIITKIAALTGTERVTLSRRAAVVMCADNGVTAEGVTQTDSSVTAVMAKCITEHKSSVCRMAKTANCDVYAVDMGMLTRVTGTVDMHIADGTHNMTKQPAMTRAEALQAIQSGISVVRALKGKGCDVIVTGEMGIGNTTTSSALASVLLGISAEQATGRGAGLSDDGLMRKINAVKTAIAVNKPDSHDALDTLAKVGGFDIAGMAGMHIGACIYRIPIIIDGLPSSVAALVAVRLVPESVGAMIASHISAEPVAPIILKELGLCPVIHANMKLGEGTGAVCMLPLLDAALAVYNSSASFDDVNVVQYVPQEEKR